MNLYIVIGAYGSGKSEYSINLARKLKNQGKDVILADLDVVNPYFRSRDVREKFAKIGIEVIAPEGEYSHADLPMISPKIRGAINRYEKTVILDVGGDPSGCKTLARFRDDILKRGYQMKFVINTKRPFTKDENSIAAMMSDLEDTSKMKINEIICNTNLMEFTDNDTVVEGIEILDKYAQSKNLLFETYLVLDKYANKIEDNIGGKKKLVLKYFLDKPWEKPLLRGI
ncbi:MAG: hypothetical protein U9N34_03280 [Candidatus Cloacimonadota bacterium]|nr:hypothetical protein [Candidatus Cloacimonadota bacterium]